LAIALGSAAIFSLSYLRSASKAWACLSFSDQVMASLPAGLGAGLAVGLGLAIPAARLMSTLPFGMATKDPTVFLLVGGVLAAVGVFACWLPARQAASLDPVKAIRYE